MIIDFDIQYYLEDFRNNAYKSDKDFILCI